MVCIRIAVIDRKKCQPKKCAHECEKFCPGVRMGDETITFDPEKGTPVINEELCTGCGICVKKCPFNAISIINLPEALGSPVHQYGKNGFRLFGLPTPKKGIVGVIGRNGTGKTTLVRILSGGLVPNMGKEKLEYWGPVLEKFKRTEVGQYLEKIASRKARLAVKPQEVDQIPRMFSGTVREMIDKYDETGKARELVREFGLESCLDTLVSQVSGGELQRAALISTISRNAEYFFFDEPSSFLDVKQRINAARIIREHLGEKFVFVVEHDLAVLDYLTDYVHVVYGKPGAYGIVSSLKPSRSGINEFLEGFLKTENVRIRDYPIRFEAKPPADAWKGKKRIEYGGFVKSFESFTLRADPGEVVKGEVVGILGPNGIGKTTFVKVLAGEEKPDAGTPGIDEKISYKPQYISLEYEGTVREWISEQDVDTEFFKAELELFVRDLYDKQMADLSGGERQRVVTAVALAKNAGICLLDEPSAYLDIEQRMIIAQKIKRASEKREITTMVVDHDIVFQDAVANRILVFSGAPGVQGFAESPESMEEGMNRFLSGMQITFRRDLETGRPRVNKPGSQLDREQKKTGKYYYTG